MGTHKWPVDSHVMRGFDGFFVANPEKLLNKQ